MDYTELLPPLPEPSNLLFHALDAKVRGHTSAAMRDYALAAIAAAAPAIRRAERERCALAARCGGRPVGASDGNTHLVGTSLDAERAIRALPEEP